MAASVEERAKWAIKTFGEALNTKEGQSECVRQYGIEVMMEAVDYLNFSKTEHPLPEGYLERVEKTRKSLPMCTKDTILYF